MSVAAPGVLADLIDWLNNPEFTAYPCFCKLVKLLDGKTLRRPVYLDVIVFNYENSTGIASPRKLDDVKFDVLEAAVLAGSDTRYGETITTTILPRMRCGRSSRKRRKRTDHRGPPALSHQP
jgi:hypothetical protein